MSNFQVLETSSTKFPRDKNGANISKKKSTFYPTSVICLFNC